MPNTAIIEQHVLVYDEEKDVELEFEVELDIEWEPGQKQTRHYPGHEPEICIIDAWVNNAQGPSEPASFSTEPDFEKFFGIPAEDFFDDHELLEALKEQLERR